MGMVTSAGETKLKILRGKADNRVALVIECDRFADDALIPAKGSTPESITQHHCRIGAGTVVFRKKIATDERLDSE